MAVRRVFGVIVPPRALLLNVGRCLQISVKEILSGPFGKTAEVTLAPGGIWFFLRRCRVTSATTMKGVRKVAGRWAQEQQHPRQHDNMCTKKTAVQAQKEKHNA